MEHERDLLGSLVRVANGREHVRVSWRQVDPVFQSVNGQSLVVSEIGEKNKGGVVFPKSR